MLEIGGIKFEQSEGKVLTAKKDNKLPNSEWLYNYRRQIREVLAVHPVILSPINKPEEWIKNPGVFGVIKTSGGSWVFHKDQLAVDEFLVLVNPSLNNRRGSTLWISDDDLRKAILNIEKVLRNGILSHDTLDFPKMLEEELALIRKEKLSERGISAISRIISYARHRSTPETFPNLMEEINKCEIKKVEWEKNPESVALINNWDGFHRGDYNQELSVEDPVNFLYRIKPEKPL